LETGVGVGVGNLTNGEKGTREGAYDPKNIESVYACSAGAVVALFFCLRRDANFTWSDIVEFIVHRPWEDVFQMDAGKIIEAYTKRGFFHTETLHAAFGSFFEAMELDVATITLSEFYHKVSPVELHFFAFDLHSFKLVDISYKTHPDLGLFQAIHMTCSLPMFMSPVLYEQGCYMDGGIITNYPVGQCLAGCANGHPTTIFGYRNVFHNAGIGAGSITRVDENSTIFDYFIVFAMKMIEHVKENDEFGIPNEIRCPMEYMNVDNVNAAITDKNKRAQMVEYGRQLGTTYLRDIAAATNTKC
jgi:hypothetical protein